MSLREGETSAFNGTLGILLTILLSQRLLGRHGISIVSAAPLIGLLLLRFTVYRSLVFVEVLKHIGGPALVALLTKVQLMLGAILLRQVPYGLLHVLYLLDEVELILLCELVEVELLIR